MGWIGPYFARVEPLRQAEKYVRGLMSDLQGSNPEPADQNPVKYRCARSQAMWAQARPVARASRSPCSKWMPP